MPLGLTRRLHLSVLLFRNMMLAADPRRHGGTYSARTRDVS